MATVKKFVFSHSDIKESAKQVSERTKNAKPMNEKKFISLIGELAYKSLVDTFGGFGQTYQSGRVIYVSIKNIDYVFQHSTIH
jgi:hypothetical protein